MSAVEEVVPAVSTASPPFHGPTINAGGWWGCPDWLIKGEPDVSRLWDWKKTVPEKMVRFLKLMEAAAPGDPLTIGPIRLTDGRGEQGERWALHQLDSATELGLQPVYLAYVEALARPAEWRWLNQGMAFGVVGGVDADGELCAFIAPARKGGQ